MMEVGSGHFDGWDAFRNKHFTDGLREAQVLAHGAREVPHISHLGNFVHDDPETDLAQDERLRHIPADMTRRLPGLTGAKNTDGIGHTNNREWRGPRCDGRKVVA